ncbi:hypothetical protein GS909_18595 [Rhodococcus hoagii]|nr:hypothetical protein [Prescottella equi]
MGRRGTAPAPPTYATNYLDRGQYRMSRDDALAMRYIEHSPPRTARLPRHRLRPPRRRDARLRKAPRPSRAELGGPVPLRARAPSAGGSAPTTSCRTDSARLTPLRYAHRIETGLKLCVGGDFSYGGQLTKNPIHPDWKPSTGPPPVTAAPARHHPHPPASPPPPARPRRRPRPQRHPVRHRPHMGLPPVVAPPRRWPRRLLMLVLQHSTATRSTPSSVTPCPS